MNAQIAELSAKLAKNNDASRQAELDELRRIIAEADALLSEDDGGSLRLSALLESMLRTTPAIDWVTFLVVTAVCTRCDTASIRDAIRRKFNLLNCHIGD